MDEDVEISVSIVEMKDAVQVSLYWFLMREWAQEYVAAQEGHQISVARDEDVV